MIKPNNRAFGAKGKQANLATLVEMHPFCLRHLPRRGRSALRFLVELCGTKLSTHSAPACGGKVVAPATKGGRRRKAAFILAPQGAHLPSGAVLYNYPGRSPQTACKAQPFTGRTLAAQGRKPRRLPQPSARRAVNLREYSQAPIPLKSPLPQMIHTAKKH